jgi:DNA recombination protein RmuC
LFLAIIYRWLQQLKQILQESRERSQEVIEEKMKREEQFVESRKEDIRELVSRIEQQLQSSQQKLEVAERSRQETFGQLKGVLEKQQQATDYLRDSTDHLKNILSNNQKRGQLGEEMAEQLMQAVGFVRGENYLIQPSTESATRPDISLLLPDKTKVNIDVKFPWNALIRHQEAKTEDEKKVALKSFSSDVRQKIKEVTSRDYINPGEGTADFVILFVPNENIFGFIYDELRDIWHEALSQKVILAGPLSFVAILRTIYWSHQNFAYQENLQEIIKLIKIFEEEYSKFSQALEKLGNSIEKTSDNYRQVAQTRHQKLVNIIDRIKREEKSDLLNSKNN